MTGKDKATAARRVARRPGAGEPARPNSTNDGLFRSQFRKTELCRFFRRGGCWKGGACDFAHGCDELQPMPDLTKTSLCRKWLTFTCTRDSNSCPFAHGEEELRSTKAYADRFAADAGGPTRGADTRLLSPPRSAHVVVAERRRAPTISTADANSGAGSGRTPATSGTTEAPGSPMLVGFLLVAGCNPAVVPVTAPPTPTEANTAGPILPPCAPRSYTGKPVADESPDACSTAPAGMADVTCARFVAEAVAQFRGPTSDGVEILLQQALPAVYED